MSISQLVLYSSRLGSSSLLRLAVGTVSRPRSISSTSICCRYLQLHKNGHQLQSGPFISSNSTRLTGGAKSHLQYSIYQQRWQSVNIQPPEQTSDDSQQSQEPTSEVLPVQEPPISSALFYFVAFGFLAFGLAAYSSLKNTEEVAEKLRDESTFKSLFTHFMKVAPNFDLPQDDFGWGAGVTAPKLLLMKDLLQAQEAEEGLRYLRDSDLPAGMKATLGQAFETLANKVLNMSTPHKTVMPILFVNTIVFLLWARSGWSSRLSKFLWVNFIHRPASGMTHTLLTSSFSHQAFWHFGFNNFALWSFGGASLAIAAHRQSIKENIPEASLVPQFLAFFATAGVFAAMASHVVTALRFRSVVQRLGISEAKRIYGPRASLGSSGAVWAVITMTACTEPDASIYVLFLPFVAIPIKYGVLGLLAVDVAGIVRGWQVFDHVAHLGGALFGFFYFQFGARSWAAVKTWVAQLMQIGPYDPARKTAHITR